MQLGKKKRVVGVFIVIYALFAILLVYLFLFNLGLDIIERINPETGTRDILVGNSSVHQIYNIRISYFGAQGEKVAAGEVEKLLPGEERKLVFAFPQDVNEFTMLAEAPFHQTVTKKIAIAISRDLDYEIGKTASTIAFVGRDYNISLSICNLAKEALPGIEIIEEHSTEFFEEAETSKTVSIKGNDCEYVSYVFTPKKTGKTKIIFNILAYDDTRTLEQEVEII